MKIIKNGLKLFLIFLLFFILINFTGDIYASITPKIDIKNANSFYLYDKDNLLVLQGSADEWVGYNDISDVIIKATISVEDKNFFEHNGFDFLRIGKAMFENIKAGEIVQGASTITQQYAKNLFLDFGQTWKRKWQEMWLTFELENHYSKEEIIEGYLNTINYGHGMYGIANASRFYFDKEVKDLSLAEATILVGIPNSPANYSPISNYELAKKRQYIVLNRMLDNKFITEKELNDAYNEELMLVGKKTSNNLSTLMYYQDAVMEELLTIDKIPKSYIETKGLKIYTSLDLDAQNKLEVSIKENINNDEKIQAAAVMINPKDGSIIALVGGKDYELSQYNRATQSLRQPGSTIKPFLYYKALENGFTASSAFSSEATTFFFANSKPYSPRNSGNIYGNKNISLAAALAYSDNIYAVKTHIFLGEDMLVDILKNVGISSNLEAVPSLPLGSYETNIIEITNAYAILANQGKKISPHFIEKIEDMNGNLLYEYKVDNNIILDPSITYIISELLTGSYDPSLIDYTSPTCINILSDLTNKYAIKSGSTDTDAWVIGYTPEVVLATWSGYDNNDEISSKVVSNNKKAWAKAIEAYLKDKKSTWYKTPKNVVGVLVNSITGQIANTNSKNNKVMYYLEGTEPSLTYYPDLFD